MHRSRLHWIAPFLLIALWTAPALADWPPAPRLPQPDYDRYTVLPPSVTAERDDYLWQVTFKFQPPAGASDPGQVNLAGSFNGWNMTSMPMDGPDANREWSRTLRVGAGEYRYKFVVDGQWTPDPRNPDVIESDYGNSVVHIGSVGPLERSPERRGDGQVGVIGLQHNPQHVRYWHPVARDRVTVRYRTFAHDVEGVSLVIRGAATALEMRKVIEGELFTYWETEAPLGAAARRTYSAEYTFVLSDGGKRFSDPRDYHASFEEADVFETPDWARHAVWYQIMPDRFRNGTTENDPPDAIRWTMDWFDQAPHEGRDGWTFYKYDVFYRLYGGDLQGVEEKLDYLQQLGVNAIYFNPIFEADTHHKYNATTFVHVDQQLGVTGDLEAAMAAEDLLDASTWTWTGSDKVFLNFLQAAKARNIRVILDGVFNHVGVKHPAFVDVRKNGKASRYADWFDVTSWEPFDYNGWAGHKELPVFRKDEKYGIASPSLRQHIFDVTRRWMDPDGDGDPSDGIDGWRLDVPNEVPIAFWVEWRKLVKSINPDAYISGEIWDRAEAWLDGRTFDAVMNYEFAKPAIQWIFDRKNKITPSQLDHRLAELRMAYPAAATYVMQNLVASHDTDRVASMALNPDRKYDDRNRIQDSGPDYDNGKPGPEEYARVRLLLLLQMTYVGAPMIYYGDEVGMWGADDPTCRKPMLWEDLQPYDNPEDNFVMKEHFEWHRRAIALRHAHPALREGAFSTLLADDAHDVWVFIRSLGDQHVIVALNASSDPREVEIALPPRVPRAWKIAFAGGGTEPRYEPPGGEMRSSDGSLTVRIAPLGGTILAH